jgi:glycosyltransferase involved in cell wall biosynthesis
LRNWIYYQVKPLIPRRVRLHLRQWVARRTLRHVQEQWPILPGSERPPAGWPGWPQGKKFTVVLTHDVEGPAGLERCHRLMRLEQQLGFRSCYNFIPEGSYRVSAELREQLVSSGFEVGVHDLRHDGKLFRSRKGFAADAVRINQHLQEWQAAGFRSGFMLKELDWLHDLNIRYDASTFDTDPFEPQPEGHNTIFPFWIPRLANPASLETASPADEPGYAELPYTLPQDSTIFLLLAEPGPGTWIRKLDWIAAHGGMVLVNVHPDYIRFEGEPDSSGTYPVAYYARFLQHLQSRYAGQYWQPLPREVAAFVAENKQVMTVRRKRRICMVTHSIYESDNRVTRYAESLVERGDEVDVIALRRSEKVPREETIAGVKVLRPRMRAGKKEQKPADFLFPILKFLVSSSWWMTKRHLARRYDLIHIHNIPDFLVLSAWLPKLTGTRVILDIHDIVPEFFGSKFGRNDESRMMGALKQMERMSAWFADHVIIANHLWVDTYTARSARPEKCSVFINNVDARLFQPRARERNDGKQIILFPGGLQWHQGIDIAIRAFEKVHTQLPGAEFHIYGDGSMKPQLVALAGELRLGDRVRFFAPRPIWEIAEIMADADLGVVPKRADSFGNEAYSTKIMEFMAAGVPVAVSSTRIDRYYFNDEVVRFFESGNVDSLAEAILDLMRNQSKRQELVRNARAYVERNGWNMKRGEYYQLVDALISRNGS